jgi:hypothetical protein
LHAASCVCCAELREPADNHRSEGLVTLLRNARYWIGTEGQLVMSCLLLHRSICGEKNIPKIIEN